MPPLRPIPGAIADVAVERTGPRIVVAFTIPAANADGTTPAAADRIDIFALTQSAETPPPGLVDLLKPELLVQSLAVAPVPEAPAGRGETPSGQAPSAPYAGQAAKVMDTIKDPGPGPVVRYYALMAMAAGRRGQPTPVLAVSLASPPAPPAWVVADNTETALTITWLAGSAKHFIVEETDERGAALPGGVRARVTDSKFQTATEFGQRRCFTVRAAEIAGAVSILGEPASPACHTVTDKFPPPAPTGLQASATEAGIELSWTAVTTADLGGYIVLRAEGANGTLQPLTTAPVTEAAYRDSAVQSGVTYAYAVVAIDTATPANRSEPSERKVATARSPMLFLLHR